MDPAARGGGLGRLLHEAFFRAAEARGCILVRAVTSPVNRGSVAFHQRMGFQLEPGDTEVGLPQSLRVIAARPAVCEVLPDPVCRWKEFAAALTIISPG